jgi:hypothetical protein
MFATIQCRLRDLPRAVDEQLRSISGPLPVEIRIGGELAVAGVVRGWNTISDVVTIQVGAPPIQVGDPPDV